MTAVGIVAMTTRSAKRSPSDGLERRTQSTAQLAETAERVRDIPTELPPVDEEDRDERPDVQEHVEEEIDLPTGVEELVPEPQMPRRADGQKLRQRLNQSEYDGFGQRHATGGYQRAICGSTDVDGLRR